MHHSSPSTLGSFDAILRYPQKFEQVRSRWESAQPLDEALSNMVGRKEKPAPDQSPCVDSSASKFRRKLSRGLTFISNPLSQRNIALLENSTGQPLPAADSNILFKPDKVSESGKIPTHGHDAAPTQCAHVGWRAPSDTKLLKNNLDPDATPKALPRSRTMSFIPRPSRSESESSTMELNSTTEPRLLAKTFPQEPHAAPSKIPTPTPPANEHRRSSPRQYTYNLTAHQEKYVAAGNAFASTDTHSPSKASIRSYTTPNLVNSVHSPPKPRFMAPRKPTVQRQSGIGGFKKATLKENAAPSSQHCSKRMPQIQERPRGDHNQVASSKASNRRSLGPNIAPWPGRPGSPATPLNASTRRSSQLLPQTPLYSQRALPKQQSSKTLLTQLPNSNGSAIAQSRLMGPINPPTPPKFDRASVRPVVSRVSIETNLNRRTFATPIKRDGYSTLPRSQVCSSDEVRVPRSSTYHNFLSYRDPPPPMPSIPEQYKSPSMPVLAVREPATPGALECTQSRRIIQVEATANVHKKNALHDKSSPIATSDGSDHDLRKDRQANTLRNQSVGTRPSSRIFDDYSKEFSRPRRQTSVPRLSSNPLLFFSSWGPEKREDKTDGRSDHGADISAFTQVKDYMPALYWAGRFQSRLDQWRTEAIRVELDPTYKPVGSLGQCKSSQEKTAACYVFLQLRELCVSSRAADSLWEFEHKYRQEHKMLGTGSDLPPLNNRKRSESSSRQGPFGRAVRKLTPRKNSFVNLLKGKGWNREEDTNMTYGTTECDILFKSSQESYSKKSSSGS